MNAVAPREQVEAARRARAKLSNGNNARDLIQLGAYQPGHDAELDCAIKLHPALTALLQQDMHDRSPLEQSRVQLTRLMASPLNT